MKKSLLIFSIAVVALAVLVDILTLMPKEISSGTLHSFSTSDQDIHVFGQVDSVNVVSASQGYYRFTSASTTVEGERITGESFANSSEVPVGIWKIEKCDTAISFTVTSVDPVSIRLVSSSDRYANVITITILVMVILFFLWFCAYALITS